MNPSIEPKKSEKSENVKSAKQNRVNRIFAEAIRMQVDGNNMFNIHRKQCRCIDSLVVARTASVEAR